jgi:branched-chain amino acid transport system ATP-binding protein
VLTVESLSVAYGGLTALREISLVVRAGQFVSIVGPNGAGKTTLFKAISGTVPEGRQVFGSMTVMENLEMGGHPQSGRRDWERNLERIFALFPILAERRGQAAGTLSGGEQQMLAIGRGIASSPRLLMLDEPSMGLAPMVADLIFERITQLHRNGLAILLVEQRVVEAVQSCDFGYVLETGRVVLEGTNQTLLAHDGIKSVYLGM